MWKLCNSDSSSGSICPKKGKSRGISVPRYHESAPLYSLHSLSLSEPLRDQAPLSPRMTSHNQLLPLPFPATLCQGIWAVGNWPWTECFLGELSPHFQMGNWFSISPSNSSWRLGLKLGHSNGTWLFTSVYLCILIEIIDNGSMFSPIREYCGRLSYKLSGWYRKVLIFNELETKLSQSWFQAVIAILAVLFDFNCRSSTGLILICRWAFTPIDTAYLTCLSESVYNCFN